MDKKILEALKILQKAVSKIQTDIVSLKANSTSLKADMVTVKADMVTKDDARKFATKDDLNKLKKEVFAKIDDTEVAIILRVDKFKADKYKISEIEERVKRIERKLSD